ncbi:MAG: hypothetical protein ACOYXT_25070 [Bacteroidota bacterium]
MAVEKDFELLDDYLANRLGEQEKTAFEQKLESDPDLKREFNLQRDLVKSIKNARVAELKAILNTTPVPPISGGENTVVIKVAVWSVVAALIATGLYFYLKSETEIERQQPVSTEIATPEQKDAATTEKTESVKATDESGVTEQMVTPKKKATPQQEAESQPAEETQQPVLDVFDPSEETEPNTAEAQAEENGAKSSRGLSIPVETDRSNKKYNFHFQFKDGKLFLYGPFEQNLYEILEFFSGEKRTVFLYYNNNYYLLGEGDSKVKPLQPISDANLIKKLKEYRGN